MSLTHEDYADIRREFDERYVKVEECNEKQISINKSFAKDDKRIEKLMDRMDIWNKLLWAIASSSIGALILSFFELVLK